MDKNCKYCGNNKSEHFICCYCGAGMCDDCYHMNAEHDEHCFDFHESVEDEELYNLIVKETGCEYGYMCYDCIDKLSKKLNNMNKEKIKKVLKDYNLEGELMGDDILEAWKILDDECLMDFMLERYRDFDDMETEIMATYYSNEIEAQIIITYNFPTYFDNVNQFIEALEEVDKQLKEIKNKLNK